jgi:uncharacterized protein (UPF0276 family)
MNIEGVGLGLRAALVDDLLARPPSALSFLEVAPENYMRRGGRFPAALADCRAKWPIVTHGLAMSLGGVDPLDAAYLRELAGFVARVESPWHSDHLCFSSAGGVVLHDLLPVPFTEEAVTHVAERVMRAQDVLRVPMAVENISYYAHLGAREMDEPEFVSAVVSRAGCGLLLDVNNLYVNACNLGFDPADALARMPLESVVQVHVAGHDDSDPSLLIDTHAAPVKDAVYALLELALGRTGRVPIVLERDDDFPSWEELCAEIDQVAQILARAVPPRQA